jgi:hypothetical protein
MQSWPHQLHDAVDSASALRSDRDTQRGIDGIADDVVDSFP